MADQLPPSKFSSTAVVSLVCVGLAAILALALYAVHPGSVRTTDAQIDGHIYPINTRVAGTVAWVNPAVEDTHFVAAGTLLARLDPNDYRPAVSRLQGDLQATAALQKTAMLNVPIASASALSRLNGARSAVLDAESDLAAAIAQEDAVGATVHQAEANYKRAEADRVRYEALLSTREISLSEYDQRLTDAKATEAIVEASKANERAAQHRVDSMRQRVVQRKEDLRNAQTAPDQIASAELNVKRANGELIRSRAALHDAELNLSYTEMTAPIGGIVGRKSLEVGQRVSAGQLMLTLVPPHDVWVIANFRETQLRHMRVGQSVIIHVDTYDRDLQGTVESLGGATGSKYSLVAPDNATGNYVKVVQRIPVRIRILDRGNIPDQLLLPGMSIEVAVKTPGDF